MNPALTSIVTMKAKKVPLLLEVPVEAELVPFLVSSSRKVIWIESAKNGSVRAAVRKVSPAEHFPELVEAFVERSSREGWGSVLPLTSEGFSQGQAYLSEYGLKDLDLLSHPDTKLPHSEGVSLVTCPWLPVGEAVLVPVDRSFVGVTFDFGAGNIATVMHNAARGIVVFR
jgi:hypothetical protein